MPRLKQAGPGQGSAMADQIFKLLFEDRNPIENPGTATGTPGNWWTVFNIVPDAFDHTTKGFQFYRSPDRKIDPKLRELGQIRASVPQLTSPAARAGIPDRNESDPPMREEHRDHLDSVLVDGRLWALAGVETTFIDDRKLVQAFVAVERKGSERMYRHIRAASS